MNPTIAKSPQSISPHVVNQHPSEITIEPSTANSIASQGNPATNPQLNRKESPGFDTPVISWTAPEYIKHEKGQTWFIVMGGIALLVAIYGIFADAWTMSLAVLLFAGVYYLLHQENPKEITISVSELGIRVAGRFYPYSLIRYFWLVYDPPHVKTLHLKLSSSTITEIVIQLENQNPSQLRNYLLQQIPEMEGKQESFTSILARIFRF